MDRRFEINDDGMCVIPDGVTEFGWGHSLAAPPSNPSILQ